MRGNVGGVSAGDVDHSASAHGEEVDAGRRRVAAAVTVAAVGWVASFASVETRRTYASSSGLEWLVWRHGLQDVADAEGERLGVRVRGRAPSSTAAAPGWRWLVYCVEQDINPISCPDVEGRLHEWAAALGQFDPARSGVPGGLGRASRQRLVTAACSFYDFMAAPAGGRPAMSCNPCSSLSRRRLGLHKSRPDRPRPAVSMETVGRIVAQARRMRARPIVRARLVAQIVVTVETACRVSGLRDMTVEDYERWEDRGAVITWHSKGEEHTRRLSEWAACQVDTYLAKRTREDLAPVHGRPAPLFRSLALSPWHEASRREMDTRTFAAQLKDCARAAGAGRHVTPHALRAAAITYGLDAGHTTRELADLAGHASVATTEVYDRRRRSRHLAASSTVALALEDAVNAAEHDAA